MKNYFDFRFRAIAFTFALTSTQNKIVHLTDFGAIAGDVNDNGSFAIGI